MAAYLGERRRHQQPPEGYHAAPAAARRSPGWGPSPQTLVVARASRPCLPWSVSRHRRQGFFPRGAGTGRLHDVSQLGARADYRARKRRAVLIQKLRGLSFFFSHTPSAAPSPKWVALRARTHTHTQLPCGGPARALRGTGRGSTCPLPRRSPGPGRPAGPGGRPRFPPEASFPRGARTRETSISRRKSLLILDLWSARFRTPPHTPCARETSHPYRRDEHTGTGAPLLQAPLESSPVSVQEGPGLPDGVDADLETSWQRQGRVRRENGR